MAGYGYQEIVGAEDLNDDDLDDLLGQDDLILGDDDDDDDDDDDMLGARLRRSKRFRRKMSRWLKRKALRGSTAVVSKPYTDPGVEPLGFFQAAVGAGLTVTITTQPQSLYRPEKLSLPPTIASFFTIDNILVGTKSQFPSIIPLPGEMFIPNADQSVLKLDTVQPAINLSLVVTNISGVAQDFRAGFVGRTVKP